MAKPKGPYRYVADDFIAAIPGSKGIITTIASRVGCTWVTASRAIEKYATVKKAYREEVESFGDMAEEVLFRNIEITREKQIESGKRVDTAEIRWWLTKKLKHRGYGEAVQVTGEGTAPPMTVIISQRPDDMDHPDDMDDDTESDPEDPAD